MAASFPSGSNTFVPSFDATGKLVVSYSRNPKDFAINQYIKIIKVKRDQGYYLSLTSEQAARVINTDLREFAWHDGNDAPTGQWGTESFNFKPFSTIRRNFPFQIGYKAVEQADWQILAQHAAIQAQLAMTARTVNALAALTNTANYDSGHADTATNFGGGLFTAATTSNLYIKKALNALAKQISKSTLGVVKPSDLLVIVDPDSADAMSRTSEIHEYIKGSPAALAQVRGDSPSQNGAWGLPDVLYGFKVVVEDCVRVTTKKRGDTTAATKSYALGGNTLLMVSRIGALEGVEGAPDFSTCAMFAYEEMTVESRDDVNNRRHEGRIVEDYEMKIIAPSSGGIITNLVS